MALKFLPDPPKPRTIFSQVLCITNYDVSMVTEEQASWKLLSPPRIASGGSLNAPDVMERFPSRYVGSGNQRVSLGH